MFPHNAAVTATAVGTTVVVNQIACNHTDIRAIDIVAWCAASNHRGEAFFT
jgi:hypothetical protein